MDRTPLDVLVADGGIGSLVVAYRLARAGRRVALVESVPDRGIETISAMQAGRIAALGPLIGAGPRVTERAASVLQPEGALSVHFASERLGDAAHAFAVVDRADVTEALSGALRALDVPLLPPVAAPLALPAKRLSGMRDAGGREHLARCSVFSPEHVVQATGMPGAQPVKPSSFVLATWETDGAADGPGAPGGRGGGATERWYFGDPFAGSDGFARLLATTGRTALSVSMPLRDVVDRRVATEGMVSRLRRHPAIRPYLGDGAIEAGPEDVTARVLPARAWDARRAVGDGWVVAPLAPAIAMSRLTTEIALAELTAKVISEALDRSTVSAAALASLPGLLAKVVSEGPSVPLGSIDAWADGLVGDPAGLIHGARALAALFGGAG